MQGRSEPMRKGATRDTCSGPNRTEVLNVTVPFFFQKEIKWLEMAFHCKILIDLFHEQAHF